MPRHFACGLSLFLAAAACNAHAQKVAIPLPENGQMGDFRTLLYVLPDNVEVRIERHWLTDDDLAMRAVLEESILDGNGQQLSFEMQQPLYESSQLHMQLSHNDNGLRGEAGLNTAFTTWLRMSAVVWREERDEVRYQGAELRSRFRLGSYANANVRVTDNGTCRNGCAELNVSFPL